MPDLGTEATGIESTTILLPAREYPPKRSFYGGLDRTITGGAMVDSAVPPRSVARAVLDAGHGLAVTF